MSDRFQIGDPAKSRAFRYMRSRISRTRLGGLAFRIRKAPVLVYPQRSKLHIAALHVAAHRDDAVGARYDRRVEQLRACRRDVDAQLRHHRDDAARRQSFSQRNFDGIARELPQESFGHLATSRVVTADEEYQRFTRGAGHRSFPPMDGE